MAQHDPLNLSAVTIARLIRERTLSPVDVIEAHIARIQQVNPLLNAVITPLFQQAREQAQAAAAYLEKHPDASLPPLFGVPITIKDSFAVNGTRFTSGSWYRRDTIAESDAVAVQRLKAAGAIILGKTNVPDMCWLGETSNPIFGQTNNPRNINYSAGGSSGGEGAIVAAGGSALGLGSDIAGSIRIPAAMNGCVGLKPTAKRIATAGHIPQVPDVLDGWNTVGPLTRSVEDAALALGVLSETPVRDYRSIDLNGRRCLTYIHNGILPVRKPVVETVRMAADTLQRTRMDVVHDVSLPMVRSILNYAAILREHAGAEFMRELGGGKPTGIWSEFFASLRGKSHITRRVLFFAAAMDVMGTLGKALGQGGFDRLEALRRDVLTQIEGGGVLLLPLLITAPPRHGWTWSLITQVPYTLMFNALGMPSVVLPIRYTEKGLPLAVQIVAAPGEDEIALAVAAELERVHGGWKMALPS